MTYRVLIVDDSSFFQMRLKELINSNPSLTVCGVASNGQEAIDLNLKLKPDIISMDYEMPYMDGVTAVQVIMAERPVPIVMFSSMTYEGAAITLQALDAGAVDFIPKNFAEVARDSENVTKILHEKLILFAKKANPKAASTEPTAAVAEVKEKEPQPVAKTSPAPSSRAVSAPPPRTTRRSPPLRGKVKLIVIGASTGGPVALAEIVCRLQANFSVPIVMVQHMPENFTKAYAERLNKHGHLNIKQASNGDILAPGSALLAPGGMQLMFDRNRRSVKILPGDDRVQYKPSVDVSFASAAQVYGDGVLGIVLTGMGSDGCEGARILKSKGSLIWSQNEESCVVYGMPAAVERANLSDEVLPIDQFAPRLAREL